MTTKNVLYDFMNTCNMFSFSNLVGKQYDKCNVTLCQTAIQDYTNMYIINKDNNNVCLNDFNKMFKLNLTQLLSYLSKHLVFSYVDEPSGVTATYKTRNTKEKFFKSYIVNTIRNSSKNISTINFNFSTPKGIKPVINVLCNYKYDSKSIVCKVELQLICTYKVTDNTSIIFTTENSIFGLLMDYNRTLPIRRFTDTIRIGG